MPSGEDDAAISGGSAVTSQERNLAESVHQRLLNEARRSSRPFNELMQYYAIERLLYRLSQSRHRERFVLKGAAMLVIWGADVQRPTRDVDMLGYLDNDIDGVIAVMREVAGQAVEPDGLEFLAESVTGRAIAEDAEYSGVRVKVPGRLGNARLAVQVDIGFGDVVVPEAGESLYPSLLGFPQPQLRGYSRESSIAEKLEAMVRLGELNSRMKDFYDIWLLSRRFPFEGEVLARAVRVTFERRGTALEARPFGLSRAFAEVEGKERQWQAFVGRTAPRDSVPNLDSVVAALGEFLLPVLEALTTEAQFEGRWEPPGPWSPTRSST
jgi:predicted nucleotidyltransferase component of viral defense system